VNKQSLGLWLESLGFIPEYPFRGRSGKRRFRFDWAYWDNTGPRRIAVEYDGAGVGHQSISGTWADSEKSNEAALCQWTLIRCNPMTTRTGKCQEWIEAALKVAS
jgi:hypothetical protein